ncbi:MAG: RHS repeat-associated core domain-containing protein, partial [Limisphaerales bacterium]
NTLSLTTVYYNENGETNWTDGPQYNPDNYTYFDYDGMGRLTTRIQWRSEANNSGTGVEQPSGYNLYAQTFYEYDPLGNLLLTVDPRGAMTTNSYNALCELVQSTHLDTDGQTVLSSDSYSYEPGGEVQSHTNALGGVTTTYYNIMGKPEYRINPDGSTNGWRYYLDGRINKQIQGNGAYWQTTYDDVNRIITHTFYSAAGVPEATNSVQQDERGNVVRLTDAGFNVFNSTYDGLDRVKTTTGPATTNITETGMNPGDLTYVTNVTQHTLAYFYDAAGRYITSSNALGQLTVNQFDAMGRPVSTRTYNSTGTLVNESYTGYSPDNNVVTVTNGSGPNAIVKTTWIDTDGQTVLSIAYPSATTTEFTENEYDLAGNLVLSQHDSSSGGSVTTWASSSSTFDGLNRVNSTTDRNGAVTYFAYDPLNDLTNRTMPGNLVWQASYNDAGQMSQEQVVGGGNITRTTSYFYYPSASPFAGLLSEKIDGRGTTCNYLYDDWLRTTNMTCTGALPEQNVTTTWQYEPRGYLDRMTEQFANSGTGPSTSIQRSYNPYGELSGESVSDGSFSYSTHQSWGVTGRRSMLNFGGNDYSFGYQADGNMISVGDSTGAGAYSYSTTGILTNRTVGVRNTGITSLDGEGRPLSINTTIDGESLTEDLSYSGDGLLQSDTLYRPDFTDSRSYSYANLSRRLTSEQLNLNNSATWTNNFTYDNGTAAGPGALTMMGQANASSGLWGGGVDAFSRINSETNNTFSYPAYGHVNGQATLSAWLDGNPITITGLGTNAMQWEASMELSPGTHQLTVAALHPSGRYTAWATNYFTNTLAYQQTVDGYDADGEITNRVWVNPSGTVEKTQSLSWDARGRLHAVTQRDASNSGYNWTAVYDPLNRRISTTTVLVTNGVAYPSSVQTINSYYDPQFEFLELGVEYGGQTDWKLYGPDANGTYGALNGVGGLDAVSPRLSLFNPTVSDVRGDVLGYYDSSAGSVTWNTARPTGYGAVPDYRPAALGSGTLAQSSAWRGHWVDITGYYNIGMRTYDPIAGMWLSYDPVWNAVDPNGMSFCGGDPVNSFDPNGRCIEGGATAAGNLLYGAANLINNAAGALEYSLTSSFAPTWSYNNLGSYAQNFANTVTGAAQTTYDVAALATYGIVSPFAPNYAYNNYGGNVQQLLNQAPSFYGGNNQSTAYQISYGTVNAATLFLGGELGEAGEAGDLGTVGNVSSTVSQTAQATEITAPSLLYHYTTAPESSFSTGLWEG